MTGAMSGTAMNDMDINELDHTNRQHHLVRIAAIQGVLLTPVQRKKAYDSFVRETGSSRSLRR